MESRNVTQGANSGGVFDFFNARSMREPVRRPFVLRIRGCLDAVPSPILLSDELIPKKPIATMGRPQWLQRSAEGCSESLDNDPMANLRRAKIGSVDNLPDHLVGARPAADLDTRQVLSMCLVFVKNDIWPAQACDNPVEIGPKRGRGKVADILEQECCRASLTYGANGLGPHVPTIGVTLLEASDPKRLAGRPARNYI